GNYTVGQVGDVVKYEVEKLIGGRIEVVIKEMKDFRNYKVTIDKAKTHLGFQPQYVIKNIVDDLYEHKAYFEDYDNDQFYNIRVFKKLSTQ
ncbi:hypothetical protein KA005_15185, partial [bacterium]|nr:hypothetical protein [bacterium]